MANKKMLIDATHAEETRVVVIDGNRLEDFDVEVATKKQLKGNIYLAKVIRVEPSLQAAFVDYGGNRHGFLAFSEIHPDYYQIPVADREALLAEDETNGADDDDTQSATTSEGGVEVIGGDDTEELSARRRPHNFRNYRIQEVIKRRQIILIQVVKEERGNKGAALTTYLSLAGRYCVLMPNTARGGGISRKIPNLADRKRLKSIVSEIDIPKGIAVIVRTAGSDRTKAEIKRDYDYLLRLWEQIRETTLKSTAPSLVHEEGNLIKRSIRDLYGRDIDEIIVDGDEGYRAAKDFMKLIIPSHAKRVKKYSEDAIPLLRYYRVENQMDAMHSPIVQLKSGGYIVISPTEALVSIDVNSGRATGARNIEETALVTNMEAADEVARQLRLRDLAGLVVIDFIDMEVSRNQTRVERQVKDAMRNDRARIQIGRISAFGLLELSRQRLRPSLFETTFEECPHCGGTGARRSTESTALHVLRAIEEEGLRGHGEEVTVYVPTAVALYILNQKRAALLEIETRYAFSVLLESDDSLIPPDHRIERPKGAAEPERKKVRPPITTALAEDGVEDDEEKPAGKRRRRGRRRRRPDEEQVAGSETTETPNSTGSVNSTDSTNSTDSADNADTADGTNSEDGVTPSDEAVEGEPRQQRTEATDSEKDPQGRRRRRGRRGGRRKPREPEAGDTVAGNTVVSDSSDSTVVPFVARETDAAAIAPLSDTAPTDITPENDGGEAAKDNTDAPPKKAPRRRRPTAKKLDAGENSATETPPSAAAPSDSTPRQQESQEPQETVISNPAIAPAGPVSEAAKTSTVAVDGAPPEASKAGARKGWWKRLTD